MPQNAGGSWVGVNSHLLSHALLLAEAGQVFANNGYRSLALALRRLRESVMKSATIRLSVL
ncbi:MAG: hypothetical protein WKF37_13750, partial [Bryobacteraceae bacterium]